MTGFPFTRKRRLRRTAGIRHMVAETILSTMDLIAPLFVIEGSGEKRPINSLPGQFHFSADLLTEECASIRDLGIPAVILFGIPAKKDAVGSEALSDNGVVQNAVRAIKRSTPELTVITDVCLCEYTDHGHCGLLIDGQVDNDTTSEQLALIALSHARSGADFVAPSDMMDGRVRAVRGKLDEAGFPTTGIFSYSVKYSSAFYGPFREAAMSAPQFGDRRGYQMDCANAREALHEAKLDADEGADILMVKPALAYLDIIRRVKENTHLPLGAYNVSGEYAMLHAAAEKGWIDLDAAMLESLTSIKRAGADLILTYFAKRAATLLRRKQ